MRLLPVVARPMLAAVFVWGGVDTFRKPAPRASLAAPVIEPLLGLVPGVQLDPAPVVRINAAVQVGAASLLAAGRFPRLAAAVLAASLVPTTVGGHRFWEVEDALQRSQQRTHLLKNLGIFGGLLLAVAMDPSTSQDGG